MKEKVVLFEKKDGIAKITLNRPDRLNAVTPELSARLKENIDDACKDDEIKVIVITGAGRGFCAGADMDGLAATSEGQSRETVVAEERNYASNNLEGWEGSFSYFPTIPKPIIAAMPPSLSGTACCINSDLS